MKMRERLSDFSGNYAYLAQIGLSHAFAEVLPKGIIKGLLEFFYSRE
jgi:hypothetical protein